MITMNAMMLAYVLINAIGGIWDTIKDRKMMINVAQEQIVKHKLEGWQVKAMYTIYAIGIVLVILLYTFVWAPLSIWKSKNRKETQK